VHHRYIAAPWRALVSAVVVAALGLTSTATTAAATTAGPGPTRGLTAPSAGGSRLALSLVQVGVPRPSPPYVAPVAGPIVDHFRPPSCRWCPGNRGVDYATRPGDPVRASAGGVVTFAGRIGADLYVTVQHRDGLRTSYAYLATIAVTEGQPVDQGAVLGTAGSSMHFGVRRGDVYLDPELLLAGWRVRPRLMPSDGAPPRSRLTPTVGGPLPWQAGS
jgi:murein DD-endopeptidase MepM/ murein hydrolase activator NlpD